MTNLEKFEETFGITIDDRFIRGVSRGCQCKIFDFIDSDKNKCEDYNSCHECPLFDFWDREYVERAKPTTDEKVTYEWGTGFVKEAIEHVE